VLSIVERAGVVDASEVATLTDRSSAPAAPPAHLALVSLRGMYVLACSTLHEGPGVDDAHPLGRRLEQSDRLSRGNVWR